MKRNLTLALSLLFLSGLVSFGAEKGHWTGYLTDTHCGQQGATKEHTSACINKCMRDGAKAALWNEGDQQLYSLSNFDRVSGLVGSHVEITGTLDPDTRTITVESASRVEGSNPAS